MYIYRSSFVANVPNALFTEEKKKKKRPHGSSFQSPLDILYRWKGCVEKGETEGLHYMHMPL